MAIPTGHLALISQLRGQWRILLKEVTAFGLIGGLGVVIELGLFAMLSEHGALKAKIISASVATVFSYFGNKYLSFSHRARTSIGRETTFFFGINAVAVGISEAIIALFVYPLHFKHDSLTVFLVNVATIGLGTIFRFWAYKRFVFLHPDRIHSPDADLDEELAE